MHQQYNGLNADKENKKNYTRASKMMDEKLIGEVQQHAIIYNRQKSNTINGDKCITKELAWQDIARNLGTDGESVVVVVWHSHTHTK